MKIEYGVFGIPTYTLGCSKEIDVRNVLDTGHEFQR
jgi:hypothetical protein